MEKSNKKKIHIIGLCGKAMSALARMYMQRGWEVSGSDQGTYDPIKTYLQTLGLECKTPHNPSNIPENPDLIVIGRHAKLVPQSNAEVAFAFEKYPERIKHLPEMMGDLVEGKENFVVAGSYGKSTTTAILTHVLLESGLDPTYMIGAWPVGFQFTSAYTDSQYSVLEGDEYPSANWDESSKFLHYRASSVLLTSAEHDHVNVFPTLADYHAPFKELLENIPKNGKKIVCVDDPNVEILMENNFSDPNTITYGMKNKAADWTTRSIVIGKTSSFEVFRLGNFVGKFTTNLLGMHNIENMLGVITFCLEHDLVSIEKLQESLATFKGVRRRLVQIGKGNVPVYEGYGTSYPKAKSAIDAVKLHFPEKDIVVVFEPHTFSWRNKNMIHWYDDVFQDVDSLVILPPPSHGKATHEQSSFDDILQRVRKTTKNVHPAESAEEMLQETISATDQNSVVLILTSGGLEGGVQTLTGAIDKI